MLRLENITLSHADGTLEYYAHTLHSQTHLYIHQIVLPDGQQFIDTVTEVDFMANIQTCLDNPEVLVIA